jgi:hypothetical protein
MNRYAAMFVTRLDSAENIASELILLQRYFYDAKNMIEMDRGSALKIFYDQWGYSKLVAETPNEIGVKHIKYPDNKGYKAAAYKQTGSGFCLTYFRRFGHTIPIKRMIEEAFLWGRGKNLDCIDAMISCELYHNNIIAKETKTVKKNVEITYMAFDANGNWKEFKINAAEDQSQLEYFNQ